LEGDADLGVEGLFEAPGGGEGEAISSRGCLGCLRPIPDSPIVVGRRLGEQLPGGAVVGSTLEPDINSRSRLAPGQVEHVGRYGVHRARRSSRDRVILACSPAAIRILAASARAIWSWVFASLFRCWRREASISSALRPEAQIRKTRPNCSS